jgi:TorA maturation chaperone TorD
MAQFGIAPNPDVKEPEDHIASLCEMMAGLIRGEFGAEVSLADQHAFFNTHVATWAGHFFSDLEGAEGSVFYAPVGKIGRAFMEIEIEAFRME